MIAVIFEARTMLDQQGRYLELAAELKAQLHQVAGFIEIERFQSLSVEGKVLSLSWWESEEAVLAWKGHSQHQAAQREGQAMIFAHYRIRVAQLLREYSSEPRECLHE